MDFHTKRKQQKDRLLKERVRTSMSKLLGSFAVTVVVGVSAVTFTQSAPQATFEYVELSQQSVFFAGEIIDDSSYIVADSLSVRLQSPFDERNQTIETGYFSGFFEQLMLNTTYELQVWADYGFGLGTLVSTQFTTPAIITPTMNASFSSLEAFGTVLDYACQIESSDETESFSTYQIKATAGEHVITQPLLIGENEGSLDGLLPWTTYQVVIESLVGGQATTLVSDTITTQGLYAGETSPPQLLEKEIVGEGYDIIRYYTYAFSTRYVDAQEELSQLRIIWESRNWYELEQEFPPQPVSIIYPNEIAITSPFETFTLPAIEGGYRVFIELHAQVNGNDTILADYEFDTAPMLFTSIYASGVGAESLSFHQYVSDMDFEYYTMTYTYTLRNALQEVVATLDISEEDFEIMVEEYYSELSYESVFHDLLPGTHYTLSVDAHYFEVFSQLTRHERIYEGEYATTAPYTLDMTTQQVGNEIEVTVTLDDMNQVFLADLDNQARAVFYYDVYTGDGYDEFYYSGIAYLAIDSPQVVFTIPTSNGLSSYYLIVLSSNLKAGNSLDGFFELYYQEVDRSYLQVEIA